VVASQDEDPSRPSDSVRYFGIQHSSSKRQTEASPPRESVITVDPKEKFFAQVAEGLQRRRAEHIAAEEAKLSEQEVAKSLEIARVHDRIASLVIDRLDARPPNKLAILAIVADLLATIVLAALTAAILLRGAT